MKGLPLYGLTTFLWLIAFVGAPWVLTDHSASGLGLVRGIMLAGALTGLLTLLAGLGLDVTGRVLGILQVSRNVYSLSRLQMVLWTWLILGGLIAASVCRTWGLGAGDVASALQVKIAPELFAVMGISYFTSIAAPSILSLKAQGVASDQQVAAVSDRMGEPMLLKGQLIGRPSNSAPKLADLVQGDDAGSAGVVDLSKVQQLLFTILLVGVYAIMLFGLFVSGPFADPAHPGYTSLPTISQDFVGLLALSHAGYLAYKAAPKPPPTPAAGPPPPPTRAAALPG